MKKYSRDQLIEAVAKSLTWSDIIRFFGHKAESGNFRRFQQMVKIEGIDTSHFVGNRVGRGGSPPISNSQWFSKLTSRSGPESRKRLRVLGRKYECNVCLLTEWQGRTITLHVDHINGENTDNTLENLRFLCPNCHQQTDTWGNKGEQNKVLLPTEPKFWCCDCGVGIRRNSQRCRRCFYVTRRSLRDWGGIQEVLSKLQRMSYTALAKELGVSDNAIRKYLKTHGVEPPRRYWKHKPSTTSQEEVRLLSGVP